MGNHSTMLGDKQSSTHTNGKCFVNISRACRYMYLQLSYNLSLFSLQIDIKVLNNYSASTQFCSHFSATGATSTLYSIISNSYFQQSLKDILEHNFAPQIPKHQINIKCTQKNTIAAYIAYYISSYFPPHTPCCISLRL